MATDNGKEAKDKALGLAVKQIQREFGKGSIMRLGDEPVQNIEAIPTGSLTLDAALGIGGVPRGRVMEIYGPESSGKTTLATHIIAEAQKMGGTCAFIDAEHAFDPKYGKALGVDIDNLLISQPDTGEQALNICDMLVRSGALDVIVIDSVAALVPQAELEGDMGDTHVGLQARLMSQALRKLAGTINRTKTCLIFINQIRMKIGVMFGCFQYNTRVKLADGTTEKIGKIVNQKLPVEVLSFNRETGKIEPRRVVNWFKNGKADHFLQFEVEGGPSGRRHFAATPNHTIFTPDGEAAAGDLRVGDEVLAMVEDYELTDDQWQVLAGGALGDGSLRQAGTHTASFRVAHGAVQSDYMHWKRQMLAPMARTAGPMGNGTGFRTTACPAVADLRSAFYGEQGARQVTDAVLDRLDARGLAVWYGDDGSFGGSYEKWGKGKAVLYNTTLVNGSRLRVAEMFERLGIGRPQDDGRRFRFSAEQTGRLHELIRPYLHPAVEHKLHPTLRGSFAWEPSGDGAPLQARRVRRAVPARIRDIYVKPPTRSMQRFDLEIEGNHTYLVDDVVVHNSPETTSGGRALKFYCSVRLDIRRIGAVKDGSDVVGNRTRVRVKKNKVAPPFKEAEFDIIYGEGISSLGELIDLGTEHGVIQKSGSWYSYEDDTIAQGREATKEWLKEHDDIRAHVKHRIRVELGMVEEEEAPAEDGEAADGEEIVAEEEEA